MTPRQIVIRSKSFQQELSDELSFSGAVILHSTPSVLWIQDDHFEPAWADCVWRDVQHFQFESITDAQKKLSAISKQWRYFGDVLNRRGALIAEKVTPRKKQQDLFIFPGVVAQKNLPVFTLADQNHIFYSHSVSRPTVDGVIPFAENKKIPPSRAYLKLWEALTILGDWPQKGERVVDLGASPGSWTWALSELGSQVLSIDRAELDQQVMKNKNIEFKKGDAFSLSPLPMDWVFSDVICFPEKLLSYVQSWIASGMCAKFVCTIKLTEKVDFRVIQQFRDIPHSRVLHLVNGKNELTWICHPSL